MSQQGAKRVLIIEPLFSGVELVRVARQLGMAPVVATFDEGDRRLPDHMRPYVDTFLRVDPNDEESLTDRVTRLHTVEPLDAVVPGVESYVATAARLAHRLGLPGQPVHSAEALRDKGLMRSRVRAAGLRVPRFAEATDTATLDTAGDEIGFPAVLKPAASSGSIQVTRVDDRAGLHRAYRELTADHRPDDVGQFLDGRVVLEEYLPGIDVSVEGYIDGPSVVVLSVTRKLVGPEPHFVEVGHIVQHDLTAEGRGRVESYVSGVCRALGVALGPFHCELRLVGGEPVLVELGARLAGGHIVTLIEWVTGVSLREVMLMAHLGADVGRVTPSAIPKAAYAGIHFFTAPHLTKLGEVTGLDTVAALPGVREVELYVEPGDAVAPYGDFRSRLGHTLFVAGTYDEALSRTSMVEELVRFV